MKKVFCIHRVVLYVFAINVILYAGVYAPVRSYRKSLEQEVARLGEQLKQKQAILSRARDLRGRVSLTQGIDNQPAAVLRRIEGAATQTQVVIKNLTPQDSKAEGAFSTFRLQLTCEGGDVALMRFIQKLQGPPDDFFIDELHLEKISDAKECLTCRILLMKKNQDGLGEQEHVQKGSAQETGQGLDLRL